MLFADAHTQPCDKLDAGTHPTTRATRPPHYPPRLSTAITATRSYVISRWRVKIIPAMPSTTQ
jgi:hypothetical protein